MLNIRTSEEIQKFKSCMPILENATDAGGRISLVCNGSKVKATLNTTQVFDGPQKGHVSFTLDNCDQEKFTVDGNTIETDFHDCSYNITQTQEIIIQVTIKYSWEELQENRNDMVIWVE